MTRSVLPPDENVYGGERSHLDSFWPGRRHEEFVWTLGPITKTLPRFRVRRYALGGANPVSYVEWDGQGGVLSSFFQRFGVGVGDPFNVLFGP